MKKDSGKFSLAILAIIIALMLGFWGQLGLKDKLLLDNEFAGGNTISYKISNSDGSNDIKSIANVLKQRFLNLGATAADFTIEEDTVTYTVSGIDDFSNIRGVITKNGNLTFRNSSDEELMGLEVLNSNNPLNVTTSNDLVYININVKDKNTFLAKTSELAASSNQMMILWVDFENGSDSYNVESESANPSFLGAATVNTGINDSCYITTHHTIEEANALVAVVNGGQLPTNVTVVETSFNEIDGEASTRSLNAAWLIMWAIPVVACAAMTFSYGIVGLISGLYALVYVAITTKLATSASAVYNSSMIMIMALVLSAAIYNVCMLYSKFRQELLKGRNLNAAINSAFDNYKVSIWEAVVFGAISALIAYILFAKTYGNAAIVASISAVMSLVIFAVCNNFTVKNLIASNYLVSKSLYAVKEKDIPDVEKGEVYVAKEVKQFDVYNLVSGKMPLIIAVCLAIIGALLVLTANPTSLLQLVALLAIILAMVEIYNKVIYKRQKPLVYAIVVSLVTLSSLVINSLFKSDDLGLTLVALVTTLAIFPTVMSELRTNAKQLQREKVNREKVAKFVNETFNALVSRPMLIAAIMMLLPLKNIKVLLAGFLMFVLVYCLTILLATHLVVNGLKTNTKNKKKAKRTTELKENTIFGINEVK